MPSAPGLEARMAAHRVLLRGQGSIAQAMDRSLRCLRTRRVAEPGLATDAIVSWQPAPHTSAELGAHVQGLTRLLGTASLQRVVLVLPDEALVATRIAETLTIYVSAHLAQQQTRFNLVRLPDVVTPSVLQRAAQTVLMFISGLLDAVHGQVLTIAPSRDHAEVRG